MPVSLIVLLVSFSAEKADAQIAIVEVIKAGVKKVIKAVDLKIQRMQNETIWLQNAQKVLENQLSKFKLTEIADWSEKQRELYGKYFEELNKVKAAIAYYQRIREITLKQAHIVSEYKSAFSLFRQDEHFTLREVGYMGQVYSGILEESVKNLDQLLLVINSFKVQMSDGKRLELIEQAAERIEGNYNDLKKFNASNVMLVYARAKSIEDTRQISRLYGIAN
ncbi:hypothetical protein SAMN05216464_108118 [Mucilaginibacter pineti]|uniref:Conjugal transfer protein TraI n=2 Tax=Mucilaginibacter pineti TaxID=1391627 RepID=A0A1G7EQ42_9SPHI|nr:hypothetical protein SAMN05216464_108118 [Mucilaginibacter pineti]